MKNIGLTLLLISVVAVLKTSGQGDVPVSMYTGSPQITVPLGSVTDHDLTVPIYLAYDATGIRVKQPSGIYGIGWNIVAGGSITREVRNLPDEGTSPLGWLNTNSTQTIPPASDVNTKIVSFTNSNACPITDSNETAVQTAINSYYTNKYDTEPDIFSFSFQGLSGQFVFDNSATPAIHLIPWQDIKVTYTQNPTSKAITAFVITTHDGVKYTFNQTSTETRTVSAIGSSSVIALEHDYASYATAVTYPTEWKLTQIVSPSGGTINFTYTTQSTQQTDTISFSVRNAPPSTTYSIVNRYTDARTGSQLQISGIAGASGSGASVSTNGVLLNDTRSNSPYKTLSFAYYTETLGGYPRTYLKTVTETSGCDQKLPYRFLYLDGETTDVFMPPPWSKAVDFWGYANGIQTNASLVPTLYVYPSMPVQERIRIVPLTSWTGSSYTIPGANRNPSAVGVMAGTLNTIQYPTGGTTNILYEPNQYYDAQLGKAVMGGGIRIKSFTYYDGMNTNATITKTFTYTDSTGLSSGRLISRPAFAVPVQRYVDPVAGGTPTTPTGDWTYEIIGVSKDLSAGEVTYGSAVGYKEVTVTRPGSGFARYQYLLPGTYGDAPTGAWAPAIDNFARTSPCPGMLDVISSASPWQFPYSRSADFDYERGLAWQKREYNNGDTLVRRTKTYYQYLYNNGTTNAPYPIYGLLYDRFANSSESSPATFLFSKYNLLMETSKVTYKEIVTTYDAAHSVRYTTGSYDATAATVYASATNEYDYLSTFHHLLTQVKGTTADGTVYYKKIRYPLDYGTIPTGADMASQMIGTLQSNFRNGTPIEQWAYVQRPGNVKKYTSGSVIKFSNFGLTNPLPQYAYSLNLAAPLTAFDSSYVDLVAKIFHNNSNYELTQTFQSFDGYGNPLTTVDQSQIPATTAWGFSGSFPVLSARNVSWGQFAFSDFETPNGSDFATSQGYAGVGRTGANSLNASGATLTSKVLQKGAPNYMLSLWLNNTVNSTFTINVQNSTQTTTYNTSTVTWASSPGSGFQYFETTVPIDPSLTSFVVVIQGASSGTALIDDVSFYPVGADLTTITYTIPYGQNSVTTNGNVTQYTVFDGLGRKKYVLDTYKNIREKDAYQYQGTQPPAVVANFTAPSSVNPGASTVFTTSSICLDGLTYAWTIICKSSSGTILQTTTATGLSVNYIFPLFSMASYTTYATLTVTHPIYGSSTLTNVISVTLPPITATACAAGAASMVTCGTTQNIVQSYAAASCPEVTAPSNTSGTAFAVSGVSGLGSGESITGYQWQSTNDNITWTNGAPASQTTVSKLSPGLAGYTQRCMITTNYGRTAYTNELAVIVTIGSPTTTPPCQQ